MCDGAKCPDRKKLKGIIQSRYAKDVSSLKERIQEVKFYCATTDIWSSRRRSFIGMTLHWLSESFERQSVVLALKRFTGTHDFENITEKILEIFSKFGIQMDKITCITTDNAKNFIKVFNEYGVTTEFENLQNEGEDDDDDPLEAVADLNISTSLLPPHQRCACHKLCLIATTDLEKVIYINQTDYYSHLKRKCHMLQFENVLKILD